MGMVRWFGERVLAQHSQGPGFNPLTPTHAPSAGKKRKTNSSSLGKVILPEACNLGTLEAEMGLSQMNRAGCDCPSCNPSV